MELPPGFRFHPTDEEIIIHYLVNKALDRRFKSRAIAEADMNKCEPWDLSGSEKNGDREWFFCKKDRKYPAGTRTNRATGSGYWKATGRDREIFKGKNCLIGMRKTLVFYKGRAPKGEKTGWIMHEYRLEGSFCSDYYNIPKSSAQEEWAICRIFRKNIGVVNTSTHPSGPLSRIEQHFLDSPTLPPLMDASYRPTSSFTTCDQDEEFIKENSSLSKFQDPYSNSYTSPIREFDWSGLRIVTENQGRLMLDSPTTVYKMEQYFSMMNSTIGVCQDTSMVPSKGETEREKPFNDEFDGLSFSPTVSNLEYLWSY